ncbi:hypothetical protein X997_4670 [Burkholderia pseudomallei A79C]|nr:hypothetical protein X997_4670 [Burkholderia pseudomallei A79C]
MRAFTIARFVPVGSRLQPFFFAVFRIAASDSPCAPAMVRSESTPARYAPSIAIQSTFFAAMAEWKTKSPRPVSRCGRTRSSNERRHGESGRH